MTEIPWTRVEALERLEILRSFRHAANATPDGDLSDAGKAAWRLAHISDPEAPPEVIRTRIKHELWRSSLGFHAARLRQLMVRRELERKPLDPNNDPELRQAMDAAMEEELASLIPKRELAKVRVSRSARFTYHDDECARQKPYLDARRAELAERIEAAGRSLDWQESLAKHKVRERERVLAICRERGAM